jgi:threonine/homoserine/homoserine lactone efflux protein
MNSSTPTQTEQVNRDNRRSLLLGIVVWFLHQNIIYGLTSLSCTWSWLPFTFGGISGMKVIETLITLIALLVIGYLIYVTYGTWRSSQTRKPGENPKLMQDTEKERRPFSAFVVMGMNAFFFLFILATFVNIFTLNPCTNG